jgi:hypothetical protein
MARNKSRTPRSFPLFADMPVSPEADTFTLDANAYSLPMALSQGGNATIHLDVGAGLTGTFSVQVSNVPFPELTTDVDWVALENPTVHGDDLAVAGSAAKCAIVLTGLAFQWARLKYADTSGSATCRAYGCLDDLR